MQLDGLFRECQACMSRVVDIRQRYQLLAGYPDNDRSMLAGQLGIPMPLLRGKIMVDLQRNVVVWQALL